MIRFPYHAITKYRVLTPRGYDGAVIALIAGIVYAVYKYLTPEYLEDNDDDDFDDDFEDYFEDEDDDFDDDDVEAADEAEEAEPESFAEASEAAGSAE